MLYDEIFGPWGRIILVGIGIGGILFAILIIVCFLTPGCLGYQCFKRPRKRKNNTDTQHQVDQQNGNIKLGDVSYRSWRLGSLYENGSICENGESPRDSYGSNYAEFDPKKNISTANLVEFGKQKTAKKLKEFPTELTLSLQFIPNIDEPKSSLGRFVIGIEALSGLPPKQYNCTVEPYVVVNIVKQTWTQRRRDVLHSFKTRGIRHTASPIYQETFVIADVNSHEAKDWTLDIFANDHDRYANHTELCSLRVPLKEVKKIFASPEIHLFNYKMKQSHLEFGSILLGISYLPTAQRLTITVMKLQDLKYPPANQSPIEFNPYVRVLMLNGKTGRKIKKKKTRTLQATNDLEFNETLTFELSLNQLDGVQFLVVLCNKLMIDETINSDHQSDSEDSVNFSHKQKDISIGKIALGKGVRGGTERLHWFSVLQNPRKLVTVWHTLK
ncbi:hypothetical protein PV325_003147 [Microctonus aethiopoides]|uniref:C2 domain-containing protein n=1 Tax=Microctonus aethiopoides TaxID=144406 RepID=A0AA39KWS2_9HYME|nr:hypothetical protein PV325_003147 [Microctonus aethiopoides]KAK0094039.1 hypothetical protein PV326_011970 [Microctonus aethiopoides]KAK0176426.1 hypothetical protein PV328_000560 [Microctonus aethiopoides]